MAYVYGLPSSSLILIAIVGYLFVALYVYAPFKIRRQQAKDVDDRYTPIELPDLPARVSLMFQSASQALGACGFHALGHLKHHASDTGQSAFASIWINPSARDSAQIIGVCTTSMAVGLKVATLVTFRTEFTDSTSIVTSNTSTRSCFPPDRRVSAVRCAGVWDVGLLYRLHQARIKRDRAGRTATLDRVKDPTARLRLEHRETYERLIAAGYYRLDAGRNHYVPTIKGAFLMTYRLLPPFRQIQKSRHERLARRTLRELGFGGMRTFLQSQAIAAPAPETPLGTASGAAAANS